LQGIWKFVSTYIIPVLGLLAAAFLTGLPIAIDAVVAFINDPLLPAFTAIYNFIQTNVIPTLQQVVTWLAINIPPAIAAASGFLNNTLLPAFNAIWAFIQNYVIPIFVAIVNVHIAAFKAALQALATFWTNILWPAIKLVYNFLNTYVIPLIKAIVNVNIAAFMLALRMLAAVWQNVVLPALTAAWNYINQHVIPILIQLYDQVIEKGLKPALQAVAFFILGTLIPQFMAVKGVISGNLGPALETAKGAIDGVKDAFGHISDAIRDAIAWIQRVADKLNSIHVPDWLQGHSPPPMANWFSDIGTAAQTAGGLVSSFGTQIASTNANVNALQGGLERLATANSAANAQQRTRNHHDGQSRVSDLSNGVFSSSSTIHNWNLSANYAQQDERTLRDEIRMQALLLNNNPTG
jgi:hypothetical protein